MSKATAARIAKMLSPKAEVLIVSCQSGLENKQLMDLSKLLGGVKVTGSKASTYREGYSGWAKGGAYPWVTAP